MKSVQPSRDNRKVISEQPETEITNPANRLPEHPVISYPHLCAALAGYGASEFAADNRDRRRGKLRGFSRPSRSNGGFSRW